MFGIIMITALLIGGTIQACRNSISDDRSKQNAIDNNQYYYLDWQGHRRRVDNNHKVLIHVTDFNTGDKVDMDMKTGQILKNYSEIERQKEKAKECEIHKENSINREKAKKEGRLWYSSYEKVRDTRVYYSPWCYVKKRVSDDLLLSDKSTNTILYDRRFELALDNESLDEETKEKLRRRNVSLCNEEWFCSLENITKEELLKYAKKIGALM